MWALEELRMLGGKIRNEHQWKINFVYMKRSAFFWAISLICALIAGIIAVGLVYKSIFFLVLPLVVGGSPINGMEIFLQGIIDGLLWYISWHFWKASKVDKKGNVKP